MSASTSNWLLRMSGSRGRVTSTRSSIPPRSSKPRRSPVLAIFAEHDGQIDPVQGAQAYQEALEAAGNPDFRVVTIPGANHIMRPTAGPCGPESSGIAEEYLDLLDEWLEEHPADAEVDR
jgi:pimeloyl-ACP methyl ester carboxylesterase